MAENVDTNINQATEALKGIKNAKESNNNQTINNALQAAQAAMLNAKEQAEKVSWIAREGLKKELEMLPATLNALPDAVKENAKDQINSLKESAKGLGSTFGVVLDFTKSTVSYAMEQSGMNKALTWMGDTMGKIGEWANGIWEHLKPTLGKMADNPAILWMLGPENAKKFQEYMGYNPDTEKLFKAINARLPEDASFIGTVNETKPITAFNDAFKRIKNIQSTTDVDSLCSTLLRGSKVTVKFEIKDNKKILTTENFAKAAIEYADKLEAEDAKKKAAAPAVTTPATPPAAAPKP